MSEDKHILIVEDNSRLLKQLVNLVSSITPDWSILEAKNKIEAITHIESNEIKILVSDLFLSENESKIIDKGYIPSSLEVVEKAKTKNPSLFVIVVTNFLDSFILNNQIIDYKHVGVNVFLDRSVTPYEKFTERFKYQLTLASQAAIFPDDPTSRLWENSNIESHKIYIVIVCEPSYRDYRDLVGSVFAWKEQIFFSESAALLIRVNSDKYRCLREKRIIKDKDIGKYPILIVGETPDLKPSVMVRARAIGVIQEHDCLSQLLTLIHSKLSTQPLVDIRSEMRSKDFWDCFNIQNIEGFIPEIGTFVFSSQEQTLAEDAQILEELLKQKEYDDPNSTDSDKLIYLDKEIPASLKDRLSSALQAGGETAFDLFISENKYLRVIKSAIKAWLSA